MGRLKFKKGYRGNVDKVQMLEREVHRLRTENESLRQQVRALTERKS